MAIATACLVAVCHASAARQDHPASPHRHAEGESLTNPVPRTPGSVTTGSGLYAKLCAQCHGQYGLGNGRMASAIAAYGARPSNLTDAEWQHGSTDGEIFLVVKEGVGPDFHMPAYGGKLAPEDIWNVVNFIRNLAI